MIDILEFAFWSGCVGFILGVGCYNMIKIMLKAARKEVLWKKRFTK